MRRVLLLALACAACDSTEKALERARPATAPRIDEIVGLSQQIPSWGGGRDVPVLNPAPKFGDCADANAMAVMQSALDDLNESDPSDVALGGRCLRDLSSLFHDHPTMSAKGLGAGDVDDCAAQLARVRYVLVVAAREEVDPTVVGHDRLMNMGVFSGGHVKGDAVLFELGHRSPAGGFPFAAYNSLLIEGEGSAEQVLADDLARRKVEKLRAGIEKNVPNAGFCDGP